jgi:RNA polymerase subunit RPABC4/transcription elongation factor Spt4
MKAMYCPNCAKAASTDQKFCRSCGFNLESTAESLLVQLNGDPALALRRKQEAAEKFGTVVFTGFGVVVAIGVAALIYTVLTRMVLSGEHPIFGMFLSIFLVFAALSLAYVFRRESLKDQSPSVRPAPGVLSDDLGTLRQLGDAVSFEHAQSVVEPTTELLMIDNKTRKFADRRDDEPV